MLETKTYADRKTLAERRFDSIIAAALEFNRSGSGVRKVKDRDGADAFVWYNEAGEAVVSAQEPPPGAMLPTLVVNDGGVFGFFYPASGTLEVERERIVGTGEAARVRNYADRAEAGEPLELLSRTEFLRRVCLHKIAVHVWTAVARYAEGKAKFQAKFAENPLYALQWASGVAFETETARLAVEPLQYLEGSPDFETLRERVREVIELDRERLFSGFHIPASSSRFSNAVELEQLEARVKFFDNLSGFGERLLWIVRDAETMLSDRLAGADRQAAKAAAKDSGLRLWNGRGTGTEYATFYVCARSGADAVRLLKRAGHSTMTAHELKTYFAETWGNAMDGITPERGVWASRKGEGATETAPERLV